MVVLVASVYQAFFGNLKCFPQTSPWTNEWVTRGQMYVLEGFRLFKMCPLK